MTPSSTNNLLPTPAEVAELCRRKYGPEEGQGWGPRGRRRFGYHLPADAYEATVEKHVCDGGSWVDVGGGHDIFPDNPGLARVLVARCAHVVAVDPSPNVHRNGFVHQRVQALIEDFQADRSFDLATLRMVVEHVTEPVKVVRALHRLLKPGGKVILLTVNRRSPITLASRLIPFHLHHPIKKFFWGGEEEDTFPVAYRMNTRQTLRTLFEADGFRESAFAHVDDLSLFGAWRYLSTAEMLVWKCFHGAGLSYPENCLLGVYEKVQVV